MLGWLVRHPMNSKPLCVLLQETNQLEYIIPEESSLERHLRVTDAKFIDFVRSLLEIDPQRRPTAKEALEHPWLSHVYDSNSWKKEHRRTRLIHFGIQFWCLVYMFSFFLLLLLLFTFFFFFFLRVHFSFNFGTKCFANAIVVFFFLGPSCQWGN